MPPKGGLSNGADSMSARAHWNRANSSLTFETLEVRQLRSANVPAIPASEVRAVAGAGPLDKAPSLFTEPQAGRAHIIGAINAARSQIQLGICNLSDPQIGDALAAAARGGVNVRVIADHADYMNKPEERAELAHKKRPRTASWESSSGCPPWSASSTPSSSPIGAWPWHPRRES